MQKKSFKRTAVLLVSLLLFSFFMATPLTAYAAGEFEVTEDPQGNTYRLNDPADDLRATFEYHYGKNGYIDPDTPITVQWFKSDSNTNIGGTAVSAIEPLDYHLAIEYTTTFKPPTNVVGVTYYYAQITYGLQPEIEILDDDDDEVVILSVASQAARIEVTNNTETRDEPLLTIEIPVVKIVEKSGNVDPGAEVFYYNLGMYFNGDFYADNAAMAAINVNVVANSIATNGVGTYNGTIVIEIFNQDVLDSIREASVESPTMFFVEEIDSATANWKYSDATWAAYLRPIDEPVDDVLFNLFLIQVDFVNGNIIGQLVDAISFTNVFTANIPITPITPKTGDVSLAALGLAVLFGTLGLAATGLSRKRQTIG